MKIDTAIVYVVDDNEGILDSLKWLIESVGYKVEVFPSAMEFLANYNPDSISCLVLDVRMPEVTGPELQEILKKRHIDIPIIFITGHGDISTAVRAMKAGAVDFLTKPTNGQLLLEAINKAVRSDMTRRENDEQSSEVLQKARSLTSREWEIMELVVQGKLTKTIAGILDLSQRTVEMHRANIMRKMGANTQVELTYIILKNGIIDSSKQSS